MFTYTTSKLSKMRETAPWLKCFKNHDLQKNT